MRFSKIGPTRFIGHLDLARTLERSLNRARIPMAYTQGFNKRMRLQLAAALPLGFTSDCELVDFFLQEQMPLNEARTRLEAKLAPGLILHDLWEVPLKLPPLQNQVQSAVFTVTLLDPVPRADLQQRITDLMAAPTLIRERRDKSYDLRPLILDLSLDEGPDLVLQMVLWQLPSKTGRPDEVAAALGLDPLATRIHRTILTLEETADTAPAFNEELPLTDNTDGDENG
ncbi:MAG: TIGR03936 family radical SAM-associated protein [Chloroflexi bacterium]|nr:TIGR03936 family radical SAM-associated protein [Chloroflexota bacterium]MBP8054224.1 TIGR03936 family radical SAM-associated protein [Chloroflexota bacterium]